VQSYLTLGTSPAPARDPEGGLEFAPTLRRFDGYMQVAGRGDRTRHAYRRELTNFWIDYLLPRELELDTVTEDDVVDYVASLPANGSKRGDVLRALRAFYGWAPGRIRGDNPAIAMRVPRKGRGAAPNLGDEELRRLLRALFRREPRRGWAAMLCFATGARVGSLVALTASDVDLEAGIIHFRVVKNDRPYSKPMNRMAYVAARQLMGDIRGNGIPADVTLLGVGQERFRQWLHEAEADAGLPRIWPHLLRHSYSNRAARGDPEAWRRGMNHADLSQWSRYHAGDDTRLRDGEAQVRLG
jgi:integrase